MQGVGDATECHSAGWGISTYRTCDHAHILPLASVRVQRSGGSAVRHPSSQFPTPWPYATACYTITWVRKTKYGDDQGEEGATMLGQLHAS